MFGSAIAIEIATELLTVYEKDGPLECTRTQMMLAGEPPQQPWQETEHGGRNKQSIVDVIDEVLKRHGFSMNNAQVDAPSGERSAEGR